MTQSVSKKSHIKLAMLILMSVVMVTAFVFYFGVFRTPSHQYDRINIDGTYLTTAIPTTDFALTDNHNASFTKENLKGHWTMMFFGFTNCGMVCPTTLDALNKMYNLMQKNMKSDQLPQVVFVSVDPDRDSVKRINDYVMAFNSHFIGVRAEIAETIALEKQFHIVAAKMEVDGKGKNQYTINHTAEILVINPQAELQALLSFPHEPEQLVKDYKAILSAQKV